MDTKEEARSLAASRDQAVPNTNILSGVLVKKVSPHPVGFFENCEKCGFPLSHADLLGTYHGSNFEIKGYHCPGCHHQPVKTYSKNHKTVCVPFNWKQLNIPSMKGRS